MGRYAPLCFDNDRRVPLFHLLNTKQANNMRVIVYQSTRLGSTGTQCEVQDLAQYYAYFPAR